MNIRQIENKDIPDVSIMLHELATEFIVHETPADLANIFLKSNSPESIKKNIANGYTYHVAEDEGVIAGFIGVRDNKHVFHLFVGKQWQGKGISRQLWDAGRQAAIAEGGTPPFTVNPSNYAVKAYERLGFVPIASMAVKNGIRFNAMEWNGKHDKAVGAYVRYLKDTTPLSTRLQLIA